MKTLWFDRLKSRHFLIPDDEDFASGDFKLRTSIGRRMLVTEEAVLPFEVTREKATEWSQSELGRLLGKKSKPSSADQEASPKRKEPDLPIFSAISGEDSEHLRTDPAALKRGLRNVGAELGSIFKDALSASEEDKARAQNRLEELKAILDEAERKPSATASTASEETERAARKGAEKSLRSFADLAGSLAGAAERAGAKLKAAADELKAQREAQIEETGKDKPAATDDKTREGGEDKD